MKWPKKENNNSINVTNCELHPIKLILATLRIKYQPKILLSNYEKLKLYPYTCNRCKRSLKRTIKC